MVELVQRFATSVERREILLGLLDYREALRNSGVTNGFQWLAGSFLEDVEAIRGRPPADIDVVTFGPRPFENVQEMKAFMFLNQHLFNPRQSKTHYKTDARFIDTLKPPSLLVMDVAYWSGLFSHQRDKGVWKGMLSIPIICDDADARQLI